MLTATASPHRQHSCVLARRIANLNSDRDCAFGSARGDAGVDLQNTLHQSWSGAGIKYLGGLVVDKNLYPKNRLWIRQVRRDFDILTRRVCLSPAGGVYHYDGSRIRR